MNFDDPIDRRGTFSTKWDSMELAYGLSSREGLGMWIADMDFAAGDFLQDAVRNLLDRGNYGYFSDRDRFSHATVWWMQNRHGWQVDLDWCLTTSGLGNGIAVAIQAFSDPGDKIAIFTPVYHEFSAKIRNGGRQVLELPLVIDDGVFKMDFDAYQTMLDGSEKMVLFCSPHNPAGRVWSRQEITDLCEFCAGNDLILLADEIHHDLVFSGRRHIPTQPIAKGIIDRLVLTTSASKAFNIAGTRTGCVMIPDPDMRQTYAKLLKTLNIDPNLFGVELGCAAYSPAGADWVDGLVGYLEGNYRHFAEGINAIPGVSLMPMQATYLSWADFGETGMDFAEIRRRVVEVAKIAPTPGPPLGQGGETCLRFNIGTQRANITEAISRLTEAFSDLQ
ncbi:MAG: MalY/PatB family protein [Paracoccaceae bacterium]